MANYPRVSGVLTKQGTDISALCNEVADLHGCPPRLIVACAIQESNLDEQSERRGVWPDVSAGLFHQTVRYAVGFGLGDGSNSAENIEYVFHTLKTDLTWAARIAASQLGHWWGKEWEGLNALSRYNSPGLAWADNPNKANIARGWAESARYVVEAPVVRTYDPDTSPERQVQDWTCSVRTATWLMRSIGIDVTAAEMQDEMVAAGLVSSDVGLHDGSGQALAAWLSERFGVAAESRRGVDWGWLVQHAGCGPIGIGSGSLYHWLAVRRLNGAWQLELMNPAPNYQSVGERLSAEAFEQWAPWAAIWIDVQAPAEEEDSAMIAELQARIAELETQAGYLQHDVADAIESAIVDALVARTKTQRNEYLAAALAAVDTLRRGGAPAEEE